MWCVCVLFLTTDFNTGTITVSLNDTLQISLTVTATHMKSSLHTQNAN
jgi:hypothetical protein